MKKNLSLLIFCLITLSGLSQKTLMIEKIGTSRKYFYHAGDHIKLRVSKLDTMLIGKLWSVQDSLIFVEELRPFEVRNAEIRSVYKQFSFPKKFGKYMVIGGLTLGAIVSFNHLINNEQVFSSDVFIIAGCGIGTGLISLSLSQKHCRIGNRWKVKVLDIQVY